jgi:hypothetical protein
LDGDGQPVKQEKVRAHYNICVIMLLLTNNIKVVLKPGKKLEFTFDIKRDIPLQCPCSDVCNDQVPKNPSPALLDAFRQLKQLQYDGAGEVAITRQEMNVCIEVTKGLAEKKDVAVANERGWLMIIDFAQVHKRIFAMRDKLDLVLLDASAREMDCVWKYLIEEMAIDALAKRTTLTVGEKILWNSRPG